MPTAPTFLPPAQFSPEPDSCLSLPAQCWMLHWGCLTGSQTFHPTASLYLSPPPQMAPPCFTLLGLQSLSLFSLFTIQFQLLVNHVDSTFKVYLVSDHFLPHLPLPWTKPPCLTCIIHKHKSSLISCLSPFLLIVSCPSVLILNTSRDLCWPPSGPLPVPTQTSALNDPLCSLLATVLLLRHAGGRGEGP